MKVVCHLYSKIISIENLLDAWEEFIVDKKRKADVRIFSQHLIENVNLIHDDLINFTYKHAGYQRFNINDPKARIIHKATVRDRLVHHAIYRIFYPIFDKGFIYDSYSCRVGKGTHKAVNRLENFTRKVSKNYAKPCWALKCDVKKYFDSVDHKILSELIKKRIVDKEVLWLIWEIISSYKSRERERERNPDRQFNEPAFCQHLLK